MRHVYGARRDTRRKAYGVTRGRHAVSGVEPYVPPWAGEDDEAETNPRDLPQVALA
jgi:hypothetical protein